MTIVTAPEGRTGTRGRGRGPLAVVRSTAVTCRAGTDPAGLAAAVLAAGGRTCAPRDLPVEGFDAVAELGRKGLRTLDRSTLLALATVGRVVAGAGLDGDTTGLVMGTSAGSLQSTTDFTRSALQGDRPYLVDPARFPNTVMNFAAGQCAIRHGLRGPDATVTAGRATVAAALRYAARWLALGHASHVIVGATEELTPARADVERTGGRVRPGAGLGEGCAALLLEPPGRAASGAPVAHVLGVATAMRTTTRDAAAAVERCVRTVLADVAEPVALHAPFDADADGPERTATRTVVGDVPALSVAGALGDVSSVSGFLQLLAGVAVLAGSADGGLVLVTATDPEGVASAVLVRAGSAGA